MPAGVIGALAAVGAGYLLYRTEMAPLATTVLRFDDTTISMRYLLARTAAAGHAPLQMLQQISFEQLIVHTAPYPPYAIRVTEHEVNAFMRWASGGADALSEGEFKEWYRQQVNESRLPEAELRELVQIRLLHDGLAAHLRARVPTVAEQVHLYRVVTGTREEAEAAQRRFRAGTSFEKAGSKLGWFPREALSDALARVVFDLLPIRTPSDPIELRDGRFSILMVTERSPARQVEQPVLAALRESALQRWVDQEMGKHVVTFHGLRGQWDSETNAWAMKRLARRRLAAGGRLWSPLDVPQ